MRSKVKDELLEFSSEESQSEDDEDGWKVTEDVEKEFYKTLSQIKNKNPNIYKKDIEFFKNVTIPETSNKARKSNPLTLRDYERKLIVEKGGELSDEDSLSDNHKKKLHPTYVEEQENLKRSFKAVLESNSDEEKDGEWGGLFKKRKKTEKDKKKEEENYKEWLKGQKNSAPDEEIGKDLKSLHDYWANPSLNEGDQFLRDYVLNKRFLENDAENKSDVSAEEYLQESRATEEQEVGSENIYNHRFEEPDQEFIKRYPRVMENTLRRKNDHRKQKREEVRERKLKEKQKKKAVIRNKQKLKKKEIEEKIEELKKLTGNDKLAFDNILDQDFSVEAYDQAMQHMFSDEFYSQDDPNFNPDLAEQEEDYNEEWNEEEYEETGEYTQDDDAVNCEDPNFNMDCDYNPAEEKHKEVASRSRRRRDKHRRTTVSEAVKKEKPTFDPSLHQSFQEYIDQYYGIDCEDFIGDLPCRFKYRRTVPNSYGLSVEEILGADDKELERWCSMKRIQQLRPDHKEKCDVKVFGKKGSDENFKRKILPSLFKKETEQVLEEKKTMSGNSTESDEKKGSSVHESVITNKLEKVGHIKHSKDKKKKTKEQLKQTTESAQKGDTTTDHKRKHIVHSQKNKKNKSQNNELVNTSDKKQKTSKKEKVKTHKPTKRASETEQSALPKLSDARLLAYGIKPKKFRNKLKYNKGSL